MTESEGLPTKRRLVRRPAEGKIGGVCAGLADYFNTDVALVRAAWVVLSIWPGAVVLGVIAYLAAWLLMPRAEAVNGTSAARQRASCAHAGIDVLLVCAAVLPSISTWTPPLSGSRG